MKQNHGAFEVFTPLLTYILPSEQCQNGLYFKWALNYKPKLGILSSIKLWDSEFRNTSFGHTHDYNIPFRVPFSVYFYTRLISLKKSHLTVLKFYCKLVSNHLLLSHVNKLKMLLGKCKSTFTYALNISLNYLLQLYFPGNSPGLSEENALKWNYESKLESWRLLLI